MKEEVDHEIAVNFMATSCAPSVYRKLCIQSSTSRPSLSLLGYPDLLSPSLLPIHLQFPFHFGMEIRTFPRLITYNEVSLQTTLLRTPSSVSTIPLNTSSHETSVSLPARMSPLTRALPPSANGRHSPSLAIFISMPRRMGSPIPKLRRKAVILNSSCVDCQAARRASSGCDEAGVV